MQIDKPNLVLPLVPSYNERGANGFAATVTNSLDQRRINCCFELVLNSITGKPTVYLSKRPGFSDIGVTVGSASDIPYLAIAVGDGDTQNGNVWVFAKNGNITRASNASGANTILNNASYYPTYVDKTAISGTETVVIQLSTQIHNTSAHKVYYASAINSWTEITDADFTALLHAGKMEHLNGFALQMATNGKIYNSDLNSLSSWSATNYITKDAQQDIAAGLAKCGDLILAFGGATVEAFYNAGNAAGSPLERVRQFNARVGMGSTAGHDVGASGALHHYYATLGPNIYFVGSEYSGVGTSQSAYVFNGSRFEKVSTPSIDKILSSRTVYSVSAMSFLGRQAVAFQLVSPSTSDPQRWLMFFPEWREWSEWTSTFAQPVNDGIRHHIGIAGTGSSDAVGTIFGSDVWIDGSSDSYSMVVQFSFPKDGPHRKFMDVAGVIGDTSRSASSLTLETSDDDGQNWATGRTIDMTSAKKNLYRLGTYRERQVRLTHSGSVDCRLESFFARVR